MMIIRWGWGWVDLIYILKVVHYKLRLLKQLIKQQIHQYEKSAMISHLCSGKIEGRVVKDEDEWMKISRWGWVDEDE